MKKTPVGDRFWDKVEPTGFCWNWIASRDSSGYGQIGIDGRPVKAHRVAYELLVGPILAGLVIDHLCRNKSCVNPDHLEPVTQKINVRRASAVKTHCLRGHEYTEENTYLQGERRSCLTCRRAAERRRQR